MQRREVLAGGGALAIVAASQAARAATSGASWQAALRSGVAALEADTGGRIGLAVHDTGDDRRFLFRGGERFPMCSSFKALLAAQVLTRADRGEEELSRSVPIAQADILDHSPFSATRAGGIATVAELARAAVVVSDNGAANLLLAASGGPAGLTRFLRGIGDQTTRLDRTELSLNTAQPGDPRDTSTPAAMVATLRRLLLGDALTVGARRQLMEWMLACETGGAKLRAGLPTGWQVADKTGAGEHGSDVDMAMALPPRRNPLLIASYLHGSTRPHEELAPVHAAIGRLIARHFA